MNITDFNAALKAIISTFDILKVAKRSELYLKGDTAGPCTFLKVFSPKQGKLN